MTQSRSTQPSRGTKEGEMRTNKDKTKRCTCIWKHQPTNKEQLSEEPPEERSVNKVLGKRGWVGTEPSFTRWTSPNSPDVAPSIAVPNDSKTRLHVFVPFCIIFDCQTIFFLLKKNVFVHILERGNITVQNIFHQSYVVQDIHKHTTQYS